MVKPTYNGKNEALKDGGSNQITAQTITFAFRELAAATKYFRADCLLGEGGFGQVYKGRLESINQVDFRFLFFLIELSVTMIEFVTVVNSYHSDTFMQHTGFLSEVCFCKVNFLLLHFFSSMKSYNIGYHCNKD